MSEPLVWPAMQRLLFCVALVTLPHIPHLPLWETVLLVLLLVWRAVAYLRHWRMPPVWARALLAGGGAAVAVVFALVKLGGRSLDAWLWSGLTFTATAKRALWRPRPGTPTRRAPSDARWHTQRLRVRWDEPHRRRHTRHHYGSNLTKRGSER